MAPRRSGAPPKTPRTPPPQHSWKDAEELLGGVPVFLFALDAHGVITMAEGRGLEPLHLRNASLRGTWIGDLFTGQGDLAQVVARMLSGKAFDGRCTIAGEEFRVKTVPLRHPADGGAKYAGIAVDAAGDSEHEVAARRAFRHRLYAEERVRMEEFRRSVLELVNHEIRTPITPIMVSLYLLRTLDRARLSEMQARALESMRRNLDRVIEVLEETLPRLLEGPGPPRAPEADLGEVVEAAIAHLDARIQQTGIRLERQTAAGAVVAANQENLVLLLLMLLDLVLGHNGDGDRVGIRVARTAERGRIIVSNAKWAPTPVEVETVMQPDFLQGLESVIDERPELLPLALVRATAEANRGRLECGPQDNGLLDLVLDFPLPFTEQRRRAAPDAGARPPYLF